MGNSTLWLYPDGDGGTLEEIDFGDCISNIIEVPLASTASSKNASGRQFRTSFSSGMRVLLTFENFTEGVAPLLRNKLKSAERHMQKGGAVSFAFDKDLAWAGFAQDESLQRGERTIPVTLNVFSVFGGPTNLALNDEVTIHSPLPENHREFTKLLSAGGTEIVLPVGNGLFYTYNQGPIFIREKFFYPVLRMPQDQVGRATVSPNFNHRTFTWEVALEEDLSGISALWDESGVVGLNADDVIDFGGTLDQVINDGLASGPIDTGSSVAVGSGVVLNPVGF